MIARANCDSLLRLGALGLCQVGALRQFCYDLSQHGVFGKFLTRRLGRSEGAGNCLSRFDVLGVIGLGSAQCIGRRLLSVRCRFGSCFLLGNGRRKFIELFLRSGELGLVSICGLFRGYDGLVQFRQFGNSLRRRELAIDRGQHL
jgi:hypothetical protein